MSWSAYTPDPIPVEDLRAALEVVPTSPPNLAGEALEQLHAAKAAVIAIVESGAVGEQPVRVSMSGHANVGHRPAEGWANDSIAVGVSQA